MSLFSKKVEFSFNIVTMEPATVCISSSRWRCACDSNVPVWRRRDGGSRSAQMRPRQRNVSHLLLASEPFLPSSRGRRSARSLITGRSWSSQKSAPGFTAAGWGTVLTTAQSGWRARTSLFRRKVSVSVTSSQLPERCRSVWWLCLFSHRFGSDACGGHCVGFLWFSVGCDRVRIVLYVLDHQAQKQHLQTSQ